MRYAIEFLRCAFHCALQGEWRAAWAYLKWARVQLGKPPF